MNKEITVLQAKALYTINKAAKAIRDARNEIRVVLKERFSSAVTKESYDNKLSAEAKEYLKSKGITSLDGLCSEGGPKWVRCEDIDDDERGYWVCNQELIIDTLEGNPEDNLTEDELDYFRSQAINIDTKEDLKLFGELKNLPSVTKSVVEDLLDDAERDLPFYDEAREMIDNAHIILGRRGMDDLYRKIENLYSLKDAVIKESGASPVCYHEDEHGGNFYLAYYEMNGFKFHLRVLKSEVPEDMLSPDSKVISNISSKNELSAEEYISVRDAVRILTDYLELPNEYVDKILNGDEVDLIERFNLTPPSVFVYSSHSYEYKEYDDYDWDDYDWNDYE